MGMNNKTGTQYYDMLLSYKSLLSYIGCVCLVSAVYNPSLQL